MTRFQLLYLAGIGFYLASVVVFVRWVLAGISAVS